MCFGRGLLSYKTFYACEEIGKEVDTLQLIM